MVVAILVPGREGRNLDLGIDARVLELFADDHAAGNVGELPASFGNAGVANSEGDGGV